MREELKQLIKLQELDTTIRNLEKSREKFAHDAAEAEQGAEAAKKSLQMTSDDVKATRREMDKRDGDLKDIEARINKLETQLNTAKSNKEYSALQHEILGLKGDKSKIEDDILKMMEQIESGHSKVKEVEKQSAEADKRRQDKLQALQAAAKDAEARVERLRGERAELAAVVSPTFLGPYERLLKRSNGLAMVRCRNFVCTGCRMSLTANTVSLLMSGDKLVYCHSCGRILYLAEGEDMTNIATAGRKEV